MADDASEREFGEEERARQSCNVSATRDGMFFGLSQFIFAPQITTSIKGASPTWWATVFYGCWQYVPGTREPFQIRGLHDAHRIRELGWCSAPLVM